MSLKTTKADEFFSKCIRERANWTCELCGTHYPDAAAKGATRSLHCSHMFGRGNWSVRFCPENAFCHCYACHNRFGSDRDMQIIHHEEVFGHGMYEIVLEKKNDSRLGRDIKKAEKLGEIRDHYKAEFERMRQLRADGVMGQIEFIGY